MISPMMSSSWSVLPAIMVNAAPVFFTSSTFGCGFWINFQGPQETCARFYFFPSISSKHLNALAIRIMYHKTDQTSFLYGLTRPSLGRCDPMLRLKLFLKKVGLSQPSFRAYRSKNNKKKKLLLLFDDDGDSCIKNPVANDNRTFGLVSNDDYPNSRCLTGKCTILTTYYNNNKNSNHNSENNVDNNFKGNNHSPFQVDYNSALTGNKPTATERNAKNDNSTWSLGFSHDLPINNNNSSENNVDNNSNSNNILCANFEENNDNDNDGNKISASTPPPSDSNADNAPPGRNNKNNVMRPKLRLPRPRFIAATECFADKNSNSDSDRDRDCDGDRAGEQRSAEQCPPSKFTKQRLPSFISHPN